MKPILDHAEVNAIVEGRHSAPFSVLGQHPLAPEAAKALGGAVVVRTFQPHADTVTLISEAGTRQAVTKVHPAGLFEALLGESAGPYKLELTNGGHTWQIIDAYSMASPMGEMDRYLFNEGTHENLYEILGSHVQQFLSLIHI